MPIVLDSLPALVLPALVLMALAVGMPFTGRRAAARRQGWRRFHAAATQRGVSGLDRELLAAWAREELPDAPWLVLTRRRDFDRFARAEVQRLGAGPGAGQLERLAALRRLLAFDGGGGPAQSTHDVRPGERVELRYDDGARADARVVAVDEAAVTVEPLGRTRGLPAAPAWAAFSRDGDGTYRFRTAVGPARGPAGHRPRHALAHGDFLLREERRRAPRAPVGAPPFWVAVERLPDGFAPDDPEGVEVEVLDVSTGGLALLADRDVRRGSELGLDLPLGGVLVTGLRARVLGRGYREGGGGRAHFLHCALVDLDPVQRRQLEEYVLEHAPA
ncbi:MAG: PilZ domain-containing protein [Planctomycetes bacterium]|nr:PilZ domain-containing protein [Planctomycetota bacterium]